LTTTSYHSPQHHNLTVTVDPDIFVAINVCKFEFKINFVPEKFAFIKYRPRNSTWCYQSLLHIRLHLLKENLHI